MHGQGCRALIAWLAVACYGLGLYALMTLDKTPESLRAPRVPHLDKLPHAVLFGFLAWLLAWSLANMRPAWGRLVLPLALAWGLASGFGVVCELAQDALPHRSYEVADMIANAVGALAAVWLFRKRSLYKARTEAQAE